MVRSGDKQAELSERQREILTLVLEEFIATAEPVGSRTLTRRRQLDVSPATVRNTMSDLEELGLLSAPHASAGRIPTALGFRMYVERLAQRGRISAKERELIHAIATAPERSTADLSRILQEAGRVLSSLSQHAALVLMPSLEEVVFRHIEFVPVREDAVLAIFVAQSGLVQNRLLEVPEPPLRDELTRMSSYLNSLLGGKRLSEVRHEIVRQMADERSQADRIMREALVLGQRTLKRAQAQEVVVKGSRNLLNQPEFSDLNRLRVLLRGFEDKTLILRLLEAAGDSPIDVQAASDAKTRVVFGSESRERDLNGLAAVTAAYGQKDGPVGEIGILGPTRMNYARVIPLVELTASAISDALVNGDDESGPE